MSDTGFGELPPEAYHDAPWARLLPWLAPYTPATAREIADLTPSPDWWITESPAVTTMMVEHETLCRRLAQMFVLHHADATIGSSFPKIPRATPLAGLATNSRVATAFQRLRAQTVADLEPLTVADFYGVRGTGHGTIEELVAGLVSAAIVRSGEVDGWEEPEEEHGPVEGDSQVQLPPVKRQLLEDLAQIAAWRRLRRGSDQPLLRVVIEEGAPEELQEVTFRLNSLTADDLLPPGMGRTDPVLEFTACVSQFDERQIRILRDRFLGTPPRTLVELGAEFGVSRERVRQLESQVKDLLDTRFYFGTAIGDLLASLRTEIQPIAALDRLIALHPDLARDVPGLDVPFWLVLDRLDDYFEVMDGWAASPDVEAAREQTRILLEDFATDHGLVDIAVVASAISMPEAELLAWLSWCGYPLYNGHVLTRTRSLADHAAGLLAATGKPLHIDDLHTEMGRDSNIRSLVNQLAIDERFVRTDRASWGLASWEVEEYTSIRQQIGLELAAAGGRIELKELVRSITSRFDVSASSVQAYAGNGDYEIVQGVVQRRSTPAAPPRKEPRDTRRLFRYDEDWWQLRLTVTRDHLRGSGFPVPSGVAVVVGCSQGEVVELESELGTHSIRWTGRQPSSGTIKRFLDRLDVREGENVFLGFGPYGRFEVSVQEAISADDHPLMQAVTLTGCAEAVWDIEEAPAALARAIELAADVEPRDLVAAYRQRGDDDIAELLERAWSGGTGEGLGSEPSGSSEVERTQADTAAAGDGTGRPEPAGTGAQVAQDQESSAPVPPGYRSAGWVRPHEAEAAVLAYQLHSDVPVHDGDEIVGWARYVDEGTGDATRSRAPVVLARSRATGERIVGWIREYEAFGIIQAVADQRSVIVRDAGGAVTGMVQYFPADSEPAERYRSTTRLLRRRSGSA